MAERLVAAGYDVLGFDIDPGRLAAFARVGAVATSADEVAESATVILTSLPSAAALDAVVDAVVSVRTKPGRRTSRPLTLIELSTLSLETHEAARGRLEAVGAAMLDCPLSGTAIQAARGDLVVYASGDDAVLDDVADILATIGRAVHRVGSFGQGTRTKLVANLLVAVHIVAAAEALRLAGRVGLDLEATSLALMDGAGTSRMLEVRGPMMVARAFDPPSMSVRLFQKDVDLIESLAASSGSPVPEFRVAAEVFRRALAMGLGEQDTASVYDVLGPAEG